MSIIPTLYFFVEFYLNKIIPSKKEDAIVPFENVNVFVKNVYKAHLLPILFLCLPAAQVLKFFYKYKPESKPEKKARLLKRAEDRVVGEEEIVTPKRPHVIGGGNEVTKMIEKKKAKIVLLAHDVDPIEVIFNFVFLFYALFLI